MKYFKQQKGFSLIEMIIYIVILTMLVLVLMGTLRTIVVTYKHIKVQRTIETSAYIAMDRITKEIKNAVSIDLSNSIFDTASSSITMTGYSPTETSRAIRIYSDQGILKIAENDVFKGQLTGSSTSVSNFTLSRMIGTETEGLRIQLTLEAGQGEYARQETFYSTALLRGTY